MHMPSVGHVPASRVFARVCSIYQWYVFTLRISVTRRKKQNFKAIFPKLCLPQQIPDNVQAISEPERQSYFFAVDLYTLASLLASWKSNESLASRVFFVKKKKRPRRDLALAT